MEIFKTKKKLKKYLKQQRKQGQTIGFVPTMGALHDGHVSLVKQANHETNISVASIFVNPTQFNEAADFDNYPRTTGQDIVLLESNECNVLYLPDQTDLYKKNEKKRTYKLGRLEEVLEGEFRPGHFQGVATIVHKLLKAIRPDKLFLGQKDFQQIAVIRKMIELKELNVDVVSCETVREKDGLAMSSRNRRLSQEARAIAPEIYQNLTAIKQAIKERPIRDLIEEAKARLSKHEMVKIEYLSIVHRNTLEPVFEYQEHQPILACIAAWYGDIRLIDNLFLN